jgi:hypothetical protein
VVVGILRDAIPGRNEVIGTGSEVNWLIDGLDCYRPPSVDLSHVDLAGSE